MITSAPTERPQGKLGELEVRLRTPVPRRLEVGRASALFVHGAALSGTGRPADVELAVGGRGVPAMASDAVARARRRARRPRRRQQRSSGASSRSTRDLLRRRCPAAGVDGGGLARLELPLTAAGPPTEPGVAGSGAPIAIAWPPSSHRRGCSSASSSRCGRRRRDDWTCVISDDGSTDEAFARLERAIGRGPALRRQPRARAPRRLRELRPRAGDGPGRGRVRRPLRPGRPLVSRQARDPGRRRWARRELAFSRHAGPRRRRRADLRHVLDLAPAQPRELRLAAARQLGHRGRRALSPRPARRRAAAAAARRQPLPRPLAGAGRRGARAGSPTSTAPLTTTSSTRMPSSATPAPTAGSSAAGFAAPAARPARPRPRQSCVAEWRRIYFAEYCRMALTAAVARRPAWAGELGGSPAPGDRALALAGDRSPRRAPGSPARQLRRLCRDDTGGSEAGMLRGLAWRAGLRLRRGGEADPYDDADLPAGIVDPVEALDRDRTPESSRDPSTPGPGTPGPLSPCPTC